SFGNLNSLTSDLNTSSSLTNKGTIDIQNVSIANAISVNGYGENKNKTITAKDETEINNSGNIKISELTEKTINKLEKVAWNLLHEFKIDISDETKGSIGNGIIVGDNVNVTNSGTIDITNDTPMAIKGTVDGEYKEVTFAGVGIGAAHSTEKAVDGARKSVKNEKTGVIDLKGTNFVGIAGVGDIDVVNSGTIKTLGDNSAAVLLMEGATLENSGTILANGANSYAVVSAGNVDDTLKLTKGSHVEGLIDLGAGNDTIDINGVGGLNNQESLTLENIEVLNVKDSNILLTKATTLNLNSSSIISSTLVNEGNLSAANGKENVYVLNAQSDKTTIENRGIITAKKGGSGVVIGGKDSKVVNKGIINVESEISSDRSWTTKGVNVINNAEFINEGTVNVQESAIAGEGARVYAGKITNTSTGKIILKGENSKGMLAYARSGQNSVENGAAIYNNGEISGNQSGLTGMYAYQLTTSNLLNKDIYAENNNIISLTGDNNTGIKAKRDTTTGKSLAVNTGEISINGSNSIGMFADNSEITNTESGEIKLNIFEKDGKTVANNKAMYGTNGSTVTNTGSIYLTDVTAETVGTAELKDLEAYVNNVLVSGDESTKVTNTGVVRNKDGKIIVAAGGDLSDKFPGIEVTPTGDYIVTDKIVAS
ncbi:MAG: hypothetical protein ACRC5F_04155, partial [Cetobacterium sp.]